MCEMKDSCQILKVESQVARFGATTVDICDLCQSDPNISPDNPRQSRQTVFNVISHGKGKVSPGMIKFEDGLGKGKSIHIRARRSKR